jgi:hypothetical protein
MAAPLRTCMKGEWCSVVRFLISEGVKPIEVHRRMKVQYGDASPKPKKLRTQPSAGKIILTLFWDKPGVLLEHYTPQGNTITSASYSDLLKNHLRPAVRSKWRGLLTRGVLLQDNNARPHTAHATIQDWWRGTAGGAWVVRIFFREIHTLCKRWRACIERNGDYVEK